MLWQQSSTDAVSGRTRIVAYEATGEPKWVAEISGLDAWYRDAPGVGEWLRPDQELLETFVYFGVAGVEPAHLSETVPRWADPFVTVAEQPIDGVNTRLVATIDAAGLRAEDAVRFRRWAYSMKLDAAAVESSDTWTWTVDVRDDGYVVRWTGRYPRIEVWSENPTDLVFESPFAGAYLACNAVADAISRRHRRRLTAIRPAAGKYPRGR